MENFLTMVSIWALPVLFAITLHEAAHAWMAKRLGDMSPDLPARITLNPLQHIDWIGTVILPIVLILIASPFVIGWAKPVPVDPRYFKKPRQDMAKVALAGPMANLLMAVLWAIVAKIAFYLPQWFNEPLMLMGIAGILINLMLFAINLVPLPPLDGGKVMVGILPDKMAYSYAQIEPYGFLILIVLIYFNILSIVLFPIISTLLNMLVSIFDIKTALIFYSGFMS